jgi:hypothetical protein
MFYLTHSEIQQNDGASSKALKDWWGKGCNKNVDSLGKNQVGVQKEKKTPYYHICINNLLNL